MQKKFLFYCLTFVFAACLFSAIFPYPVFSKYTNITEKNAYEINNFYELELNSKTEIKPKILNLTFDEIDLILPETFEIIDLESELSFYATRIGGKNHADIIFSNANDLVEVIGNFSWQRRPVLVNVNDKAFLPASLACYPHGEKNHFCLHFKNSKTDGTKQVDTEHQKTVKNAKKIGNKYIKNLS